MVRAVCAATGAAGGAVLSAAGDRRAAGRWRRHAAGLRSPAAGYAASQAPEVSTVSPRATRSRSTGETNASDDFRIGSGDRRGDRERCARDGVRRRAVRFVLAVWADLFRPLRAGLFPGSGLYRMLYRLRLGS